jgi:hypothetical protein
VIRSQQYKADRDADVQRCESVGVQVQGASQNVQGFRKLSTIKNFRGFIGMGRGEGGRASNKTKRQDRVYGEDHLRDILEFPSRRHKMKYR